MLVCPWTRSVISEPVSPRMNQEPPLGDERPPHNRSSRPSYHQYSPPRSKVASLGVLATLSRGWPSSQEAAIPRHSGQHPEGRV